MQLQEKFHLSEEKVLKLLKHAGKGNAKQEDRLLAGDFDPNQVKKLKGAFLFSQLFTLIYI